MGLAMNITGAGTGIISDNMTVFWKKPAENLQVQFPVDNCDTQWSLEEWWKYSTEWLQWT